MELVNELIRNVQNYQDRMKEMIERGTVEPTTHFHQFAEGVSQVVIPVSSVDISGIDKNVLEGARMTLEDEFRQSHHSQVIFHLCRANYFAALRMLEDVK